MSATHLRVRRDGAIVRITLDGDAQLNAVSPTTLEAICMALADASGDETARVVVLRGAGRAFCAGADLARLPPDPALIMECAAQAISQLVDTTIPVIAAVQGAAAGYGVSLVAASDIVLAGESATFSLPFGRLGLMPDGGLTHLLPATLGRASAAELAFSGRRLSAVEAAGSGLVSRVVPDAELTARVDELAGSIAEVPRRALTLTKQAFNASGRALLDAALAREGAGQTELLADPNFANRSAAWAH